MCVCLLRIFITVGVTLGVWLMLRK